MKRYTPKKKKKKVEKPVIRTKLVRIDVRTVIEVSASIPDEVAIEHFHARRNMEYRAPTTFMRAEVPSVSLEELLSIVDDSILPDEE